VARAALAAGSDALIRSAGAVYGLGAYRRSASLFYLEAAFVQWLGQSSGAKQKRAARTRELVPRHCERSEAIQCGPTVLDCFVASLLAMAIAS
jgi:hypothetical protein